MSVTDAFDDAPLNGFHKRLLVYSSGGPFLDGYVLCAIGVALIQATPQLNLSLFWQGMIGASSLVGIFLGGFVGGWFTDLWGRKLLYTLDLIAIAVSSVAQFWVDSALALFIWRLVLGIAVGADYPIATSLLAEFTPKKYRGPFVGSLIAMWYVGAAAAYLVGYAILLHGGEDAWRWILASATVPTVLFVFMRYGTPESPRWLLDKGRAEDARKVLIRVCGPEAAENVDTSLGMKSKAQKVTLGALFKAGYGSRMLFIAIFWTCSIVPVFAIYAFAPKILEALGLVGDMNHFGSALITSIFMVGSFGALFLVNKIGRRPLLMHSFFWSGLALLALGVFPGSSPEMVIFLFCAYAFTLGGTQILQFVYPNELFPTEIRGAAVGLGSSTSRIGAAIGTYLIPLALDSVGIGMTMIIAAVITFVGLAASYKLAPETKGRGLEEAASLSLGATTAS